MRMNFRKAYHGPVLSRDQRVRQGRVVKAAHTSLASIDAVRAFLNSHHSGLRGRPLDLAVASDAGLHAVEIAICVEARRSLESC